MNNLSADDHQLVAEVLSGPDTSAFGELIRRHQSQVRNFLRKLSGDNAVADDLAQDSFIRAWDKLHTFSGRGSFIGWLLKIAYTTFLQSKRRSKRYAEILEEVAYGETVRSQTFTTDNVEAGDIDKLLAVLGDEERAIIVMSYACGLSHREISEATGQPVGSVKSVIHRGKEKIRNRFNIEDHQHGRQNQRH